jgi:O-antigen/teichoic acid export membrane protein
MTYIVGRISFGGTIITISLNIVLIPRFGMIGPAIAAFGCYFFMTAAAYIEGKKHFPMTFPIEKMLTYLGVAVLGYVAITLIPAFLPDEVIYRILVGGIIFSLYLLFLFLLERKELLEWIKQTRN